MKIPFAAAVAADRALRPFQRLGSGVASALRGRRRLLLVLPWFATSAMLHSSLLLLFTLILWLGYAPPSSPPVAIDLRPPAERPGAELEQVPDAPPMPPDAEVRTTEVEVPLAVTPPSADLPENIAPAPLLAEADPIGLGGSEMPPVPFGEVALPAPSPPPPPPPAPVSVPRENPFWFRSEEGRRSALLAGGGTPASEAAVSRGLKWLARHQEADGQWTASRFEGRSGNDYDVAVTGLAVLAFLGAGNTPSQGPYRETVQRAARWLERNQDRDGAFSRLNYSHGIATLALSEALAMKAGEAGPVARAMRFLEAQQTGVGGWDYREPSRRSDTSITGWMIFAAKSAKAAGVEVSDAVFRGAERHFRAAGAGETSASPRVAYVVRGREPGEGDSPATLAIGLACLQVLGWSREDRWMIASGEEIADRGPDLDNLYYTYYATLAQFQMGGDSWQRWNRAVRDPLIARQESRGEEEGSWSAGDDVWGHGKGGDIYSTALAIMCLEVYYRYLPIYRTP